MLQQMGLTIAQALGGFYIIVCVLRILLQASGANYFNPFSRFVVNVTQPVVGVLDRVLPTISKINLAAITWLIIVQFSYIQIMAILLQTSVPLPIGLTWAVVSSFSIFLSFIYWCMLCLIILSLVMMFSGRPVSHPIVELVVQIMSPIMRPFQKVLPPMGGLDLSPFLIFLAIRLLQIMLDEVARSLNLNPIFVIGF